MKNTERKDLMARLLQSKDLIKEVVLALAGSTRRDRQNASSVLALGCKTRSRSACSLH